MAELTQEEVQTLYQEAKARREAAEAEEADLAARLVPALTDDELRTAADRMGVDGYAYIAAYKNGGVKK